MQKSIFKIFKMDCASEEQLIKMKLQGIAQIHQLEFDLAHRELTVFHIGDPEPIADAINQLNLQSTHISTTNVTGPQISDQSGEKKLLWTVLAINGGLFVIELVAGFLSYSMGLVADSLDMLADAIVYGMSLYAVGKLAVTKQKVARISGYFQMSLAVIGLSEVVRRFLGYEAVPGFQTMIIISVLALTGNAFSLYLLQRSKSQDAHIRASMIFTNNDVIVNIGVILAGVGVYITNSKYPDLIIGCIVFLLVANGARRILKLAE
jgi:Co/Zn/Cd efflux system component